MANLGTKVLLAILVASLIQTIPTAAAELDDFDVVGVDSDKRLSFFMSGGLGSECRPCEEVDDWKATESVCFKECLADTLGIYIGCKGNEVAFELSPLSAKERNIFAERLPAGSEVTAVLSGLRISTEIKSTAFVYRDYDENWTVSFEAWQPDFISALANRLRISKPTGQMELWFGPFKYSVSVVPEQLLGHMLGLATNCEKVQNE